MSKLDNINILPTDISLNSLQSTPIHNITSNQFTTNFTISHIMANDPLIFLEIEILYTNTNTSYKNIIQSYTLILMYGM